MDDVTLISGSFCFNLVPRVLSLPLSRKYFLEVKRGPGNEVASVYAVNTTALFSDVSTSDAKTLQKKYAFSNEMH